MTFQDPRFIFFFVAAFTIYWLLGHRKQNILLLVLSCSFYGFINIKFLALLVIQVIATYYLTILMDKSSKNRKSIFIISLIFNILILSFFKYYNFFTENINNILLLIGLDISLPVLAIMFPLGISFYTFQNISYVADVYQGIARPSHDLVNYGLFVTFFPKLISGPIERASNFLAQIDKPRKILFDNLVTGLTLFIWGYFQKSVIADNISFIIDKVFFLENPNIYILSAGTFAFTIQILADFSGYTDMARGLSKLLGFDLSNNFDNPYLAKSPSDFWRRWHMSFSLWIKDYIYIPLGGSRVSVPRWVLNLFIAFFFTGLWHGASWNFIIWGLYYWLLYLLYRSWKFICPAFLFHMKRASIITIPIMFLFTNIGWLIFKERDLNYLGNYFTVTIYNWDLDYLLPAAYLFIYTLSYALPLLLFSFITFYNKNVLRALSDKSIFLKAPAICLLIILIMALKTNSNAEFIYFNF